MSLSADQLAQLQQQLQARRTTLIEHIREALARSEHEHFADLAGQVHDAAEESVADMLVDVDLAVEERQVAELRELEAAQARMHQGVYGRCESCGVEIAYERLKSQPAARRCLECQAGAEQEGGTTPSI